MKNIKKNLFSLGLTFSMILGLIFSFNSEEAQAFQAAEIGDTKITCWSYGTAPLISFRKYVDCATCTRVKGKPLGGQGQCSPS